MTVNKEVEREPKAPQTQNKVTDLRVATSKHLQKWTKDMVHTEAVDTLVHQLSKGPSVYVVKGRPGEGKTTIAKMAMKKLQDMGREVFIVKTPEDFFAIKTVTGSIILLNDVFGSSHFNRLDFSRWEGVFDDHLSLVEHKEKLQPSFNSTILLVSRSSVLDAASKHFGRLHSLILKKDCVMDLTKEEYRYTSEEKRQIWFYYARDYKVDIEESIVRKVCRMALPHGFPHCCRVFANMYSKNRQIKMENFFLKPLEFLHQGLTSAFEDDVAGPILRDMIGNGGEFVMDPTHESREKSFQIKKTIRQYEGLYLRREGKLVTFHHPSIYDAVAFIACKEDPLFVVQNCSLTFLNDRVHLEGLSGLDIAHETRVTIDGIYKLNLVNRMKDEVEGGNISDVLSHNSFHDEHFVREFMEKCLSTKKDQNFWSKLVEIFWSNNDTPRLVDLIQKRDEKTKKSFLFLCSKSKSDKVLQYVCERVTLSKEDQTSVLFGICKHSSATAMQYFLRKYPECDLSVQNERKETLLIVAAQNPCDEILRTLITRGVSVKEEDSLGQTALHYVCFHGVERDASLVKMMVMNGADVNKCNERGETPSFTACYLGYKTIFTALLDSGAEINKPDRPDRSDKNVLLTFACFEGRINVVTTLIDKGADVNIRPWRLATPLTAACLRGHNTVVTTLLHRGADVNKPDWCGNTPLTAACGNGYNTVVTTLLDRGADITKPSEMGSTPLTIACRLGYHTVVRTLINRGADINKSEKCGKTPLTAASDNGHDKVVTTLLDRGADINKADAEGITPLTAACQSGFNTLVKTLLRRGVDVKKLSEKRKSPSTAACLHRHNSF